MKFRGGEFSTGTTGNFQPELTGCTTKDERGFLLWTCEKKNEVRSGPTLCKKRKG